MRNVGLACLPILPVPHPLTAGFASTFVEPFQPKQDFEKPL
jgi:hypothetical protein